MSSYFLDTSFLIAFHTPNDSFHAKALEWKDRIYTADRLYMTLSVLIELGNFWARKRSRRDARRIIELLLRSQQTIVVPVTKQLFQRALLLYAKRQDKEWGLTDCISFVVIDEFGLTKALSIDKHFREAGYRALLLEE